VGREIFEDVVRQAYLRHREARGLPAVEQWGRSEGQDRDRQAIEIDAVVRLLDGRIMTGSAKFRSRPADATVLLDHLDALKRLAVSGRSWAQTALRPESPMLFVSAAGFRHSFHATARDLDRPLVTWGVDDLF
jgi:hypothetical protein